jgi:hypothetical protein
MPPKTKVIINQEKKHIKIIEVGDLTFIDFVNMFKHRASAIINNKNYPKILHKQQIEIAFNNYFKKDIEDLMKLSKTAALKKGFKKNKSETLSPHEIRTYKAQLISNLEKIARHFSDILDGEQDEKYVTLLKHRNALYKLALNKINSFAENIDVVISQADRAYNSIIKEEERRAVREKIKADKKAITTELGETKGLKEIDKTPDVELPLQVLPDIHPTSDHIVLDSSPPSIVLAKDITKPLSPADHSFESIRSEKKEMIEDSHDTELSKKEISEINDSIAKFDRINAKKASISLGASPVRITRDDLDMALIALNGDVNIEQITKDVSQLKMDIIDHAKPESRVVSEDFASVIDQTELYKQYVHKTLFNLNLQFINSLNNLTTPYLIAIDYFNEKDRAEQNGLLLPTYQIEFHDISKNVRQKMIDDHDNGQRLKFEFSRMQYNLNYPPQFFYAASSPLMPPPASYHSERYEKKDTQTPVSDAQHSLRTDKPSSPTAASDSFVGNLTADRIQRASRTAISSLKYGSERDNKGFGR